METAGLMFVIGRILFGGYFVLSGINHFKHLKSFTSYAQGKGVMMPREATMLTGLVIILGGAGILLGVAVQLSVLLIAVFLLGVSYQMHAFWKLQGMERMNEEIQFKKNLALLGADLMFLAIPLPWVLALF